MSPTLSIGDFAKATHLSAKALRHYHDLGILEPAEVDPHTGYRRYDADQISTALVIRRFRDLDMPLEQIGAVLSAPDIGTRDRVISSHLEKLEADLRRTRDATVSLRALLEPSSPTDRPRPEHVSLAAEPAAAISAEIGLGEAGPWWRGALAEIQASLDAQDVPATGIAGAMISEDLFTADRGALTVFIPAEVAFTPIGRVEPLVVPAVEMAMVTHRGSHSDIDLAYGTLGEYVSRHALALDRPIREYYVRGPGDGSDEDDWETRIGWPIFRTSRD